MADKAKAIIISNDEALTGDLAGKLAAIADIQAIIRDAKGSYHQIKEQAPGLLFVDVRDDAGVKFGLADRVARFLPHILVFILNDAKDPDVIIRALKAGVSDFILLPLDHNRFPAAVRLALEKDAKVERDGEVMIVSSNKGGQGVTTIAVNLADHIYTLTGGRVLVVDLKLQTGDVALFLGVESSYTVVDLLKDMPRLDEDLLFSSLIQHSKGFYALPAPEEIGKANTATPEEISRMFHPLKGYMDYIIVDIASEFSEQTAPVIDLAEKILLVSQQSVPALKSVGKAIDLFRDVGYRDDKVKIVINRYDKSSEIGRKEIEALYEQELFATVANDYYAVTSAINKGALLNAAHDGSPADRDIAAMAEALTGIQQKMDDRAAWADRGVLRTFFSSVRRNKRPKKGDRR